MNRLVKVILQGDENVIFILHSDDGYWFWVVDITDFKNGLPFTLEEYEKFANDPENEMCGYSAAYYDSLSELENDESFREYWVE